MGSLIRLLEGEGRTLIKQLQISTGGRGEGGSGRYAPWRDTGAGRISGPGPRRRQGQGKKQSDSGSDSDDSSGNSDPGSFDSDELSDGDDQDYDDDRTSGSKAVKGPTSISKRSESRVCVLLPLHETGDNMKWLSFHPALYTALRNSSSFSNLFSQLHRGRPSLYSECRHCWGQILSRKARWWWWCEW